MSHDVYICYDDADKKYADALFDVFKSNNISSWVKSREMSSGDSVDKITRAIEDSKCFILLLSNNSKATNYVITETDIAFSRNIPIIAFIIEDLKLDRNLEFILENQEKIPSFPNTKRQLETLVKKTSSTIAKPQDKVRVDSRSAGVFEKINPNRTQNSVKKYLKIVIPVAVIIVLIYLFVIVPTGQKTTDDGVFVMNITNVDVSPSNAAYKYTVYGESYNMPSDSQKYMMNIKFFDEKDNMLFEINSTADEFKSGIIGSCELDDDNITHIGFKLSDLNNKVLSKQDYVMS
jgi:hypothetical protein